MNSKQTRIVMLAAVLVGIVVFALVSYFGPVAALPSGGGGFVIVLCTLAALYHKKPPATSP